MNTKPHVSQLVDKFDDEVPSNVPGSSATQKITFATIQEARLDKLLTDMMRAYDREMTAVPLGGTATETGLGSEIETASSLQRYWESRFKSQYIGIDKYRYDDLMSGSLKDVVWSTLASDSLGVWAPKEAHEISEVEGNTTFVPGR